MTRRLFPARPSDANTFSSSSSSSATPAQSTSSTKHPTISAPIPKRSQGITSQQLMNRGNIIGSQYRLEPQKMDRRPSWESTRKGQVYSHGKEGAMESLVSVVVTEPEESRSNEHDRDMETIASTRENHSLRNDESTYSMYTSQCVRGLREQEDGVVTAWIDRLPATPSNASQTSFSPSFDIRPIPSIPSIPSTPTLSPTPSLLASPASTSPATPPPTFAQCTPRSSKAQVPRAHPQSPPLQSFKTLEAPTPSSPSPIKYPSRLRSHSFSPSPSVPSTHSSSCGLSLSLFHPTSLSHRSSSPQLKISSPRPLGGSEDWDYLPSSSFIPRNKEGWAQKYAPMVEEEGWGRWCKVRPEVRAREAYRNRREPPPIPERGR